MLSNILVQLSLAALALAAPANNALMERSAELNVRAQCGPAACDAECNKIVAAYEKNGRNCEGDLSNSIVACSQCVDSNGGFSECSNPQKYLDYFNLCG